MITLLIVRAVRKIRSLTIFLRRPRVLALKISTVEAFFCARQSLGYLRLAGFFSAGFKWIVRMGYGMLIFCSRNMRRMLRRSSVATAKRSA